jgi:ribosomal protein S18 acetylase RimI-like enzyme
MPLTTEIVAADRFSPVELAELFTRGYEGYYVPIQLTADAFTTMVGHQDLVLESSRVMLEDGRPVAFAMLAVRGARGWIGGMGVVPEARGRGLGRAMMAAVIERAAELGLDHVDLEVLVPNESASRIYEALGFRDLRMLHIFERAAGTPAPAGPRDATTIDVAAALDTHFTMYAPATPWQRDRAVLDRVAPLLSALAVRSGERVDGVLVYRRDGGRLPLLALSARSGAGDAVLDELVATLCAEHADAKGVFLNVPDGDPALPVLERAGFVVHLRQREMRLARPGR